MHTNLFLCSQFHSHGYKSLGTKRQPKVGKFVVDYVYLMVSNAESGPTSIPWIPSSPRLHVVYFCKRNRDFSSNILECNTYVGQILTDH